MAFCTKCGAANPDNTPYCSACGNPMATHQQFCTRCGSPIPAGMTSCPKCAPSRSAPSGGSSGGFGFQAAGDLSGTPSRSAPAPTPSYSAPEPTYTAPEPSYSAPEPTYAAPEPTYAAPSAPAYTPVPAPAPTYNPAPPAAYPTRDMAYAPSGAYGGAPAVPHKTDRNWFLMLLLSCVTCGIYSIVVMTQITNEVNTVCTPHDNRKSMHYCLLFFLVAGLTLGIGALVWYHNICDRIGNELRRRGINYSFGAGTFWGWGILGSFILVGPFIFLHKFFTAVNLMNADYNQRG